MIFTTVQLASFAFTPQTLPSVSKEFRDAVEFIQNIVVIRSTDLFDASFVFTECLVVVLLIIMPLQERVEFVKFRSPDSKPWKYLWLVMSGYSTTCVTVGFIPITKMLLRALDCTHIDGVWTFDAHHLAVDGSASGSTSSDFIDTECWTGRHWLYVVSGVACFVVFVTISVRLLRVGGEMASLEVKCNFFDWRGDAARKMPREHPLSLKNPVDGMLLAFGKLQVVGAQVWFCSMLALLQTKISMIFAWNQ